MFFQVHSETIVAKGNSMDYPVHIQDSIEIMICIDGTLGATCNQTERILKKGEMVIAFPNDIHSYFKTGYGKRIMIIVSSDFSKAIKASIANERYKNFVKNSESVIIAEKLNEAVSNKNILAVYGYVHILFSLILEKTDKKTFYYDVTTFNRAIKYISQNYTNHLTLKELSKKIGVSQAHLSRLFSEKIEGGFSKYIKSLKVEKAKELLKSSDMNIYDIMLESGFSDQSTFNRVFKSITKITPKEYRKK